MLKGIEKSEEEIRREEEEEPTADTEILGDPKEVTGQADEEHPILEDSIISKKIAAIEAHKRSRSAFFISLLGIAGSVMTAIFVTISTWAGAAAACVFSGVLAMLAVRNLKDTKMLESTYGIGNKK